MVFAGTGGTCARTSSSAGAVRGRAPHLPVRPGWTLTLPGLGHACGRLFCMVSGRHLHPEWSQHRVRPCAASLLGDTFLLYFMGYNPGTRLRRPVDIGAGRASTKYHRPEHSMYNNGNNSDYYNRRPSGNRAEANVLFFCNKSGSEPRGNSGYFSGTAAPEQQYDNDGDGDNGDDNGIVISAIHRGLEAAAGEPVVLCSCPALQTEYAAKITDNTKNIYQELWRLG